MLRILRTKRSFLHSHSHFIFCNLKLELYYFSLHYLNYWWFYHLRTMIIINNRKKKLFDENAVVCQQSSFVNVINNLTLKCLRNQRSKRQQRTKMSIRIEMNWSWKRKFILRFTTTNMFNRHVLEKIRGDEK